MQRITLGEAVELGHVTLIRGASLSDSDLVPTPDVGVLRDPRELRSRDQLAGLTFRALGAHEHLRVTEPGDLIFATRGTPIVLLDDRGGLVVAAPSRVLRCHIPTRRRSGLMPRVGPTSPSRSVWCPPCWPLSWPSRPASPTTGAGGHHPVATRRDRRPREPRLP